MKKLVLSLAVAAISTASFAANPNGSAPQTVQLVIMDRIEMSITPAGTYEWGQSQASSGQTFAEAYAAHDFSGGTMTVSSNRNFSVSAVISGSEGKFNYTNNGFTSTGNEHHDIALNAMSVTMPHQAWSSNEATSRPFSTSGATAICTGTRGGELTGGLTYNLAPGLVDGGTYTCTVTYTATQL